MALDLSNTARSLLKSLGDNVFYVINKSEPVIDPDTGLIVTPGTDTRENFYGAMTEYSAPFNANSNIQTGDKLLIASPDANIKPSSVIEIYDGSLWAIVNPNEVNTVGVTQVYELQIRRQ